MITLKEMVPGIRYKVMTNGTMLKAGDSISIDEWRSIDLHDSGGWLVDWTRLRNKIEVDIDFYQQIENDLVEELAKIRSFIEELKIEKTFGQARDMIASMPKWQRDYARECVNRAVTHEESF